jgi:hypothetical protein
MPNSQSVGVARALTASQSDAAMSLVVSPQLVFANHHFPHFFERVTPD